jgi:hypothetical protein
MAALFPPGSQSSDKYANHGEYQYAVSAGNALSLCQRKELHHLHTTWRAPDYAPGFNLGIGIGPVGIGIGPAWGRQRRRQFLCTGGSGLFHFIGDDEPIL